MSDRYLFRAKRLDNEKWEIGSLIALPNGEYEIANKCQNPPDSDPIWKKCVITHKVDKKTVCQCTGLKDKNGTLIWENDIVVIPREDGYFSVDWDEDTARFVMNGDGLTVDFDNYWSHEVEVVGNRMDNPELMEAE